MKIECGKQTDKQTVWRHAVRSRLKINMSLLGK